ncbi:hypothetical protein CISG_02520 [Coccidioides immitis RMSCC 3703]|uniref:Uncharacterized protein n=1 Tax=Coccidioides immitis RMSCC 3703 TaxID=454286 RepID=A0A0J8RB72_COCIT|nr:hypothetical protein CISG_02520 [Coccidioides immitis RMSCC 3703]
MGGTTFHPTTPAASKQPGLTLDLDLDGEYVLGLDHFRRKIASSNHTRKRLGDLVHVPKCPVLYLLKHDKWHPWYPWDPAPRLP